jgi:hypothetical protein
MHNLRVQSSGIQPFQGHRRPDQPAVGIEVEHGAGHTQEVCAVCEDLVSALSHHDVGLD